MKTHGKTRYIGGWSNGSTYDQGYEFTNLRDAKTTMRKICDGNVFAGSTGRWSVDDIDGNRVAEGIIRH